MIKRTVLFTGAAGFIGAGLTQRLLQKGDGIVDIDIFDSYYKTALKKAGLRQIEAVAQEGHWRFETVALEDGEALMQLFSAEQPKVVVNLADPAGVLYAIENPAGYIQRNLVGFGHILEDYCHDGVGNLVYAFRTSVYGGSHNLPFNERQPVNHPVNIYATSKKPIAKFFQLCTNSATAAGTPHRGFSIRKGISEVDAINRSNSEHSNIKI